MSDFEHNSVEHQKALQEHFSQPTDYGFFTALRNPDAIETLSWGSNDALPSLLEYLGHYSYDTYLVKHEHLPSLVAELVDLVCKTANNLKTNNPENWKQEEAVYIASWKSSNDNCCLVGVASSLQDGWNNPKTPCCHIVDQNYNGSLEDGFECIEERLDDGATLPLDAYFSAVLEHVHTCEHTPLDTLEQTLMDWADDYANGESQLLNVVGFWQAWCAKRQNNLLHKELGAVEHVPQKPKVM